MSLIRNVNLHDADGNPIGSFGGAINVHDADVHTVIVNKYAYQDSAVSTTLTVAVVGDGTVYQVSVADATGFTVGSYLHINTSTEETTLPKIVSTTAATGPATFTLDRRLDRDHSIGDTVTQVVRDMASQVASMASPQSYKIGPQAGDVWHITRLLFTITHSTAGDLGLFGNIAALTNGVTLRANINGVFGTFTNWKTNSDIKDDMYDVEFDARSGGGGTFGTTGRGTFKNAGAIVRLDGTTGDYLEVLVQDDITALDRFTIKFQGHFESV